MKREDGFYWARFLDDEGTPVDEPLIVENRGGNYYRTGDEQDYHIVAETDWNDALKAMSTDDLLVVSERLVPPHGGIA